MKKQYIISEQELSDAINKMRELRRASLMCRDVGDAEGNRELYLQAKGFEKALKILGII